ncbi:MAG TPA: 50S ribosomal protein L28 [Candidatus Babeliales bacterium]|nr:50S ribosomal protein L28 [Candidatus Babeliales bacterium]
MSNICKICDKRPQVGNLVSHARNRVKRWVYPNIQKIRFTIPSSGSSRVHNAGVCTRCMKAGKIQKVV